MSHSSQPLIFDLRVDRDLEYWDAEDRKCHGEARRKMFWELITLEGWMVLSVFCLIMPRSDLPQSLGLGRPATIHLSQIDCKMPAATQRAMSAPDASRGWASVMLFAASLTIKHRSARVAHVEAWSCSVC
jgi:hypothetical protein